MDSERQSFAGPPQADVGPDGLSMIHADGTVVQLSLAGGWADLIDRIKRTAAQLNEDRARLHQREELLQALAQQTRQELEAANDRAARAEAGMRAIQAQSQRDLAHWQHRVAAAEAKVQAMQNWMAKVRAVVTEGPAESKTPGGLGADGISSGLR